jgi:branched-chain amino acid transport system substrate-binding protein
MGSGAKVESAVEGLELLGKGKEINFDGASGPCEFTQIGDILDTKFRYERAEKGKFTLLRVG